MAVLVIPTSTNRAFYSQRVRLDGREYLLRFRYNQRENRYYLAIADEEGAIVRAGIKIVCNFPLLRYYRHDPRVPPGELVAQTLSTNQEPPGFGEMGIGRRVELTYYSQS